MGCHSGKASEPRSNDNPASASGTLLAPQISPEKESSDPENQASQTAVNRSQAVPTSFAQTMIVTDSGKLYSTFEGIARALDVYHDGWVASFTDVKNGDTGTLLSEVFSPHHAVALRIHRNGAIVCLARKGVELAGVNGVWGSGQEHSSKFAGRIGGDMNGSKSKSLVWADGRVSPITIDETTGVLSVTFEGAVHTAELREDDKIHWCDGDVWSRHRGPGPKAGSVLEAILAGKVWEESMPDAPAAAAVVESRPSAVDEATEGSSSAAISPNAIKLETSAEAPQSWQQVGTSKVESEPLSPEKPLFALAAAEVAQNGQAGASDKKARRERTMCCC